MSDRRRGIVLVVVLFFALLLTSTVATFTRKALIDHMIVANRDARSEADALARGGVRMAMALLLEDRYRAEQNGFAIDHGEELWARVSGQAFPVGDRGTLELRIEDLSSRLNLNAVIQFDDAGNPEPVGLELLNQLLLRAIDEIPLPPGDKLYDPVELAANLVDYVDDDPISLRGGAEDDLYLRREPPFRVPNRPLLSVDELRQVAGFDGPLVESLRPRITVYPYAGGGGINPNTAPPHVLALLFFNDGVDLRLAPEDAIREILEVRDAGGWVCAEASAEGCTPIGELVSENAIYPTPNFTSDVFRVVSRGQVGEVQRVVEAVFDRGQATTPLLLSWRVR
ncbi:MAG: type II secretion system minor pseudopilin GspK [Myxococcota bacterium]